jgi:DNA-binding MarR family transcriptional regulator
MMSEGDISQTTSEPVINQPGNKEAIELWRTVTLQSVRNDAYNLSARQMALLLTVYTQDGPHTVKSLATTLNITKPPICRALDSLSKYKLTTRRVDKSDRRVVYIETTEDGFEYLAKYSENIMNKLVML